MAEPAWQTPIMAFEGSLIESGHWLPEACTILEGLSAMDQTGLNVVAILANDGRLVGVATDGDIRRAILRGAALTDPLMVFANANPTTCHMSESRSAVLDLMLSRGFDQIPVVDDDFRFVGTHTMRGMLGGSQRGNPVLVLAGGRGRRLGSRTLNLPKPMIRIAGRPILERLLDHIVGYGFTEVTLSVAYLAAHIEEHFGDGQRHGCRISYLRESVDNPRGSGGPLIDFVKASGPSVPDILVTNGDLVTSTNLDALMAEHETSGADITIVLHSYTHDIPYGVVHDHDGGWVSAIEEKPTMQVPVNAGIYVFNPAAVTLLDSQGSIPMTDIIAEALLQGRRVRAFRSNDDWHDVGSPGDLARARGSFRSEG